MDLIQCLRELCRLRTLCLAGTHSGRLQPRWSGANHLGSQASQPADGGLMPTMPVGQRQFGLTMFWPAAPLSAVVAPALLLLSYFWRASLEVDLFARSLLPIPPTPAVRSPPHHRQHRHRRHRRHVKRPHAAFVSGPKHLRAETAAPRRHRSARHCPPFTALLSASPAPDCDQRPWRIPPIRATPSSKPNPPSPSENQKAEKEDTNLHHCSPENA